MHNLQACIVLVVWDEGEGWGGGGGGEKVSPKPSMMAKALSILTGTILGQHPTTSKNYFCVQEVGISLSYQHYYLIYVLRQSILFVYKSP